MTAAEWNEKHPVGTHVRFQPVNGIEEFEYSNTRSEAWELGHGAPVVKIFGRAGGVLLSHLQVVAKEQK